MKVFFFLHSLFLLDALIIVTGFVRQGMEPRSRLGFEAAPDRRWFAVQFVEKMEPHSLLNPCCLPPPADHAIVVAAQPFQCACCTMHL